MTVKEKLVEKAGVDLIDIAKLAIGGTIGMFLLEAGMRIVLGGSLLHFMQALL